MIAIMTDKTERYIAILIFIALNLIGMGVIHRYLPTLNTTKINQQNDIIESIGKSVVSTQEVVISTNKEHADVMKKVLIAMQRAEKERISTKAYIKNLNEKKEVQYAELLKRMERMDTRLDVVVESQVNQIKKTNELQKKVQ